MSCRLVYVYACILGVVGERERERERERNLCVKINVENVGKENSNRIEGGALHYSIFFERKTQI